MIKLFAVEVEAYQDGSPAFKITAIDGVCAEIEIQTYQSEASWPETSAAILEALKMMQLGEEGK